MTQIHPDHQPLTGLHIPEAIRDELSSAVRSEAAVLVTADKGSGRNDLIHYIHQSSRRAIRPLAAVNCSAVPEEALYSLLFGHTRGSSPDAHDDALGWCERMHRGTVVLEEVGHLTPRLQDALVNFLETGEIRPLGATLAYRTVDVRIISTTSTDLHGMTLRGQFREDLFYRLNVIHLVVPALASRNLAALPPKHGTQPSTRNADPTTFL